MLQYRDLLIFDNISSFALIFPSTSTSAFAYLVTEVIIACFFVFFFNRDTAIINFLRTPRVSLYHWSLYKPLYQLFSSCYKLWLWRGSDLKVSRLLRGLELRYSYICNRSCKTENWKIRSYKHSEYDNTRLIQLQ